MHAIRSRRAPERRSAVDRQPSRGWPPPPARRWALACGVLLLLLSPPALFAAPRAVIVEPLHVDRGEVEPDQIQKLEWTLRNDGDEELSIEALEPTCYCVTVRADSWKIAPGSTTKIHASIDPSDFVDKVHKGFVLQTSDTKTGQLEVDVEMVIRPGIAVVPPELDFGAVPATGSPERTVDLKAGKSRPFEVTSVEVGVPFVSVEQEPLQTDDRAGVRLHVKVAPGAPAGAFKSAVVVHTNDAAKPRIEIPVRGSGAGGLHAEPERLVFQGAAPGAEVGTIAVRGKKGVAVTGVRTSSPQLEAKVQTQADGTYAVLVKVASGAKSGRILAKLFVATSDATQPELTVPVMGFVR